MAFAICLLHVDGTNLLQASQISTGYTAPNFDESKVNVFHLPDPLVFENGQRVNTAKSWVTERRPEIIHLFEKDVYGRTPEGSFPVTVHLDEEDKKALEGKATRLQLTLSFKGHANSPELHLLLYTPNGLNKPVPVFIGLNFNGNQSVDLDNGISLGNIWVRNTAAANGHALQRADEHSRGASAAQWQAERILSRGYALATMYYGDIEPDFEGGIVYGVRSLFLKPGQTQLADDDWGSLGAWAWGLSRIADYLQTNRAINAQKIALIGHSRLGKASLWAAAQDTRFSLVISNESGKGGASLAKRHYGETVEHLNHSFPHWFCKNYRHFIDHTDELPVDGNMLLALIAPRPLYVASAEGDQNSDPKGEFLSAVDASRVYALLGKKGLETKQMPPINHPAGETVAYHIRAGKHDVTAFDWEQYLNFADLQFGIAKDSGPKN